MCVRSRIRRRRRLGTAFAADIDSQPLTRAFCDKAGMRWNDAANVCAGTSSQPLTRADCDRANMRWNKRNQRVLGFDFDHRAGRG